MAAWPPAEVLDLVAALPRPEVPGLRWTGRAQWHVTLRFLGGVDDPEAVAAALESMAPPAVGAVLGPAVGRFGRRVLHVPVAGLEDVAGAVTAATAGFGVPPEDRPFAGHITLARASGRGAGVDLRPLAGRPIAATWDVGEVALVRSHLSSAGARYEVVERFALSRPASEA